MAADGKRYDYRRVVASSLSLATANLLYNAQSNKVDALGRLYPASETYNFRDAKADETKQLVDSWVQALIAKPGIHNYFVKKHPLKPTDDVKTNIHRYLLNYISAFVNTRLTINNLEEKMTDAEVNALVRASNPIYSQITDDIALALLGPNFSENVMYVHKNLYPGMYPAGRPDLALPVNIHKLIGDYAKVNLMPSVKRQYVKRELKITIDMEAKVNALVEGKLSPRVTEVILHPSGMLRMDWDKFENFLRSNKTIKILKILGKGVSPDRRSVTYDVISSKIDKIASALHGENRNKTLQVLDLQYHTLSTEAVKTLADALHGPHKNNSLTTLSLVHCEIGADGVSHLAKALHGVNRNTTLQVLDLSLNPVGAEGAKHLADALHGEHKNSTLHTLRLRFKGSDLVPGDIPFYPIGNAGLEHLAKALHGENRNMALKVLDLRNIAATTPGIAHLAKALHGEHKNTTLESLILDDNMVSNAGAKHLADALHGEGKNTTLRSLSLKNARIVSYGIISLAKALYGEGKNTALRNLDLSGNHFGGTGSLELAKVLSGPERNTSLEVLNISSSSVVELKAIAESLYGEHGNNTLRELDISNNGFNKESLADFENVITHNNTLKKLNLSGHNYQIYVIDLGTADLFKIASNKPGFQLIARHSQSVF